MTATQEAAMLPELSEQDVERIRTACSRHTPQPEGYLQWHAWAARMMKTHRQVKCEGCGLWQNWIPKVKRTPKVKP